MSVVRLWKNFLRDSDAFLSCNSRAALILPLLCPKKGEERELNALRKDMIWEEKSLPQHIL